MMKFNNYLMNTKKLKKISLSVGLKMRTTTQSSWKISELKTQMTKQNKKLN